MSKQKRKKVIDRAEKFVKKYSWEKTAKETLDVYEKLGNN